MINIVWADDDNVPSPPAKRKMSQLGIKLLCKCNSSEELVEFMKSNKDKVHAIITDANFSDNDETPESERDISGLEQVFSLKSSYEPIPIYLYTARPFKELKETLEVHCNKSGVNTLMDWNERGNFFEKGGEHVTDRLFNKIIEDFKAMPRHKIVELYKNELKAAEEFLPGASDTFAYILELLDKPHNSTIYQHLQGKYTTMRTYLEELKTQCINLGIIPRRIPKNANGGHVDITINDFAKMMWHGSQYKSVNGVMEINKGHKTMSIILAFNLQYVAEMTNNGSHRLDVIKHSEDTSRYHLLRATVFAFLELLVWYKDVKERVKSGALQTNVWQTP